nr:Glycosyl hydrolases family 38 N-terminal domain protein [uncultured bacterium]
MGDGVRRVVVVFKTHFDLGFTGLPDEVMAAYTGAMFDAVVRTMEATANEPPNLRYAWTLPAWPLRYLLHSEKVAKERRRKARKLVEDGRLHWHVWPFTTHTAFCGLEDMVRGLHVSRSLSEEFGRWPTGAKQTDVPGHTWILPSLLVGTGVKFLHLGCNAGSHAPHVPRFFWWEGPDGARLLTFYSPGGYGTSLLPPPDWEYDTWISLQQTVDNHGPHTPEELLAIRRTIEQGAPGAEIVFGQLGDFSDSLMEHPEQLEGLPVVPYDLADTWIHGVGTMPREVARARELRGKLLKLEALATILDWPSPVRGRGAELKVGRSIAPDIDRAYEQLMLFGEHTWGLDVKSTIKRVFDDTFEETRKTEPYLRLQASWDAKADYVAQAEDAYESAEAVVRSSWIESGKRNREQVMRNPSPARLEWEAMWAEHEEKMRNAPHTEPVRTRKQVAPDDNVLENRHLRVEVDPAAGGIKSIFDKWTKHEWVDTNSPEPFGGYRHDLYSAVDIAEFLRAYGTLFHDWFIGDFGKPGYPEGVPHVTSYARNFTMWRVHEEGFDSLLLTGGTLQAEGPGAGLVPGQTISIKITLVMNWVELEYKVENKQATPLTESIVVPFPMNIQKATFRLGQVGSSIDPARDIAEGANRELWCVDRWMDVSDDRIGLAVMPRDVPLVSIGNTGIYKFEPDRVPKEPVVYAHLANTQWGTNFPQWLEGDFTFGIDLEAHLGDWRTAKLWERSQRVHAMDITLEGESGVGDLPIRVKDWQPEPILMALRPRHDGQGLVARYWNGVGMHRKVTLEVGNGAVRVWRCDLMERPMEELPMRVIQTKKPVYRLTLGKSDPEAAGDEGRWSYRDETENRVYLEIAPYAIETLLIEFE